MKQILSASKDRGWCNRIALIGSPNCLTATTYDVPKTFMKSITAANYQKHQFYPAIARSVHAILKSNRVVAPVDVLLHTSGSPSNSSKTGVRADSLPGEGLCRQSLQAQHHPPYSPPACASDWPEALSDRVSQVGPRRKTHHFAFSKSGAPALEAAYSRHYVARARPSTEQPAAEALDIPTDPPQSETLVEGS